MVRSLNDLPDHILLRILSYLPTTSDAIEKSLLSRKWRNLWLSVPSLTFSSHSFFTPNSCPSPETLRFFTDFIEQTLILRPPTPLVSLKVQFDFPNLNFTSNVDSWIRFAISNNAQILNFDLFDYNGNALSKNGEPHDFAHFEFPFYVLRDSSQVRVLKLRGCKLSLPPPPLESSRFYSLRSLLLGEVVMPDQILVDLMVACVNLEALDLSYIMGCKHFEIRSSKLRELTLKLMNIADGSVEIVTPNLYTLNLLLFHLGGDYALKDVSSLVEANVSIVQFRCWVKVMRFLGHVERLTSPNMWAQLLELKDVNCFILQNLKCVELHTPYTKSDLMGIKQLLVLSPNLQTLILAECPVFLLPETKEESISEDFIRQLNFSMPSLRHVKMTYFMGTDCEKYLLIVLLKTAVILEKIVIIPAKVGEESPQSPIILDPQFNGLQDFEYFVRPYPRQKTLEERITDLRNSQGDRV